MFGTTVGGTDFFETFFAYKYITGTYMTREKKKILNIKVILN